MGVGKGTKQAHEASVLGPHATNACSVPATFLLSEKIDLDYVMHRLHKRQGQTLTAPRTHRSKVLPYGD